MQNYSGGGDVGNDYDDRIAIMEEGDEIHTGREQKHKKT